MEPSSQRRQVAVDPLRWGRIGDWAQLVRLPAVFTLLSNCAAAALLSVGSLAPLTVVLPICGISVLAYWAGMILNDVHDVEEDRRTRPSRPLAAGRISPVVAGHVATGMLMLGPLMLLLMASYHRAIDTVWMIAAIVSSLALWVAIRLYNSAIKATLLGPMLMGACRALNILMVGFSFLAIHWGQEFSVVERFPQTLVAYAAAVGVYICGVTTYARHEAGDSSPLTLSLGTLLEVAGLVILACLYWWEPGRPVSWYLSPTSYYPILIVLIGLTVLNRALAGVLHPVSRKVQLSVRHALLSLIFMDAAVALMWCGPWYGVGVVALLLPALLSAIRLRTT
ncbi:MAG: UbiA family prenyltransferase [Pirellulaceae bacterium]|nr:UbiA family prenyltransferase [Pirellulaceae bacterium]